MQTTVSVDDELLKAATKDSGEASEVAAVEAALRLLIQMRAQARLRELRGKIEWEGDLTEMRRSRF